jgi:DNA-directed RNA polymerase specialized sigma24 family protein
MGEKQAVSGVETDEASFVVLVDRYHNALLRLAMTYTADRAVAEEVVQETWASGTNLGGRSE